MAGLSGLLTALNVAGNIAHTVGTFANAGKQIAGAFGGWGQTGDSQSSGGSISQGGGHSESGSQAGTNIQQVDDWLKRHTHIKGKKPQCKANTTVKVCLSKWATTPYKQSCKAYITTLKTA